MIPEVLGIRKSVSAAKPNLEGDVLLLDPKNSDPYPYDPKTKFLSLISEIDAPPVSKELKKRWSYFIREVYETDPLICPKFQGEMHHQLH